MFRILIVEDEQGTYEQLAKRIPRKIPEARVDVAVTVSDARRQLHASRESREPYDAIVLDIKLPESQGEHPEMDETLCDGIKELMPSSTIVAHVSAYLDDAPVKQHMKEKHEERVDRSFRLSKMDVKWVKKLEEKLMSFLYGTRIETQMTDLFGNDDELATMTRNRTGSHSGIDDNLTQKLFALSRDISAHWTTLDESLQARIERAFVVTKKDKRVIVSFF